jgi:hypothetical protein
MKIKKLLLGVVFPATVYGTIRYGVLSKNNDTERNAECQTVSSTNGSSFTSPFLCQSTVIKLNGLYIFLYGRRIKVCGVIFKC